VLGMLKVLVVLVVLEELVVFVGCIIERVKSQNFLWGKISESKKKKVVKNKKVNFPQMQPII
jgi:Na+-transporting methylmalonyl-CoA/oxaloacetate decarboxylase gamma subunit